MIDLLSVSRDGEEPHPTRIKSERRIYDIGPDPKRAVRSEYYEIEQKALSDAGLQKAFVRELSVESISGTERFQVFEWVRPD